MRGANREQQLIGLVRHLIEELYSAWYEGAADCHTTGEDDRWERSDANKTGQDATAKLVKLLERDEPNPDKALMEDKSYSHQYLIAVTVESDEPDPEVVSWEKMAAAVARRLEDIILHDRSEAFQHNDTEEVE